MILGVSFFFDIEWYRRQDLNPLVLTGMCSLSFWFKSAIFLSFSFNLLIYLSLIEFKTDFCRDCVPCAGAWLVLGFISLPRRALFRVGFVGRRCVGLKRSTVAEDLIGARSHS